MLRHLGPTASALSALLALLAGLPVNVQAAEAEASFGLSSATVLRGVALGSGAVDADAAVGYADPQGWRFALGTAALHDRTASGHWDLQAFLRAGVATGLGGDWSVQAALAHFDYPASALLRRYSRHEASATLAWRDRLYLSATEVRQPHADDGRLSHAIDLVARQPLPLALTASAGLGRLAFSSEDFGYRYGHLALSGRHGATLAQIAWIVTDAGAKAHFGAAASNRWTASFGWTF